MVELLVELGEDVRNVKSCRFHPAGRVCHAGDELLALPGLDGSYVLEAPES